MHRSSESVAALASALAKAQAELVNPEKSLTATIRDGRGGEGGRTFRYAPLSSGLDIVRKALGQHEIATMQTTAIDPSAGIVKLTTMLAHASGEWIASDWPVCPVAEMASPQRMGAALTYARRYALFTLVGIAGEDDLDAPDLCERGVPSSAVLARGAGNGRIRGSVNERTAILDAEQSAAVRERLLTEITTIGSAEFAATWARKALVAKNGLTAADARVLEDAFELRLSELSSLEGSTSSTDASSRIQDIGPQTISTTQPSDDKQVDGIDKSTLAIPEPRRYRNRKHLRFVAQQVCLICGRKPSDPHHLGFTQPRALGRKVSDEFVVPLCRGHHRALHRSRNEQKWWKQAAIDPTSVARKLWNQSRHLKRIPGDSSPHHADEADSKIA